MLYGYARCSSTDQDLTIQIERLTAAGCKVIRSEKVSGSKLEGRGELQTLLDFIQPGDTLVVVRVDRLARSIRDLQNLVHDLRQKGVAIMATDQSIDTSTAAGQAFLGMLGVFAEFENNIRKERQDAGIAKAKADGKYTGRKPTIDAGQVMDLAAQGLKPTAISDKLMISRASVYRIMKGAV